MSMTFSYTKYTSDKPLSKKYTLDGDLICKEAHTFSKGTAETITCSFEEFRDDLQNAGANIAFGYGTHDQPNSVVSITTGSKENIANGLIARNKDNFKYRNAPGIGCIDHDTNDYAPKLTRTELVSALITICSSFAYAPMLLRDSVSSGVARTGQDCKANGGVHIYFPVLDAGDMPRFGKALEERLWLAGYGFVALSANGSLLLRTLIDSSVFSGERLDFVGAPEIGTGLSYIPPEIECISDGFDEAVDTSLLKSLSEEEHVTLLSMQSDAKANMLEASKAKKAKWLELKIAEQVAAGTPEACARDNLVRVLDNESQDLCDDFLIAFADHNLGTVSVSDILAALDKYNGKACADPIEGTAYGRTTAMFYKNKDKPIINSHAHGGCKYFLHDTGLSVIPVDELKEEPPRFKKAKNGVIKSGVRNIQLALQAPHFSGYQLGHDEFTDQIMFQRHNGGWQPFTDELYTELRIALSALGFAEISSSNIREVVHLVARNNKFDSAKLWLNSLQWDGIHRVRMFAHNYFGTEDTAYTRAVSEYMWTAMAGRTIDPGCQVDMVPILVGAQGLRKSTAVAALVTSPEFCTEITFDDDEDKTTRKMRGVQVVEISELRGINTKDAESIKAFITRKHEKLIPKYKEYAVQFPRRSIFIGTTNQEQFLGDSTGSRRWLPLTVTRADTDAITRDRDQLWAEASIYHFLDGVMWEGLEDLAKLEHESFKLSDPWQDIVSVYINEDIYPNSFTTALILEQVLDKKIAVQSRTDEMRVAAILKALGFVKERVMRNGTRVWEWTKPESAQPA